MSKLALTVEQVDSYVRKRVDRVLIGKSNSTPRRLHIPSEHDATDVSCKARTSLENWNEKPIAVYPPCYHKFCPWCVDRRFSIEVIDDE